MAMVISTDLEPVKVQAFGNWFEFKAGQTKNMQDGIADFLGQYKREMGFVVLPSVCEEDPDSKEAKAAKEEALSSGRRNIVQALTRLRANFETSTQKDIDRSGEKRSYYTEAEPVHKEMYRRLALFQSTAQDAVKNQEDEIKKLQAQLDGTTPVTNPKQTNPRS